MRTPTSSPFRWRTLPALLLAAALSGIANLLGIWSDWCMYKSDDVAVRAGEPTLFPNRR